MNKSRILLISMIFLSVSLNVVVVSYFAQNYSIDRLIKRISGAIGFQEMQEEDNILSEAEIQALAAKAPATEIQSEADIISKRNALVAFIWNNDGFPSTKLPDSVQIGHKDPGRFGDLDEVIESVDKITVRMDYGIESIAYLFHAQSDNGQNTLIIYHEGHVNDFMEHEAVLNHFLSDGYAVLAFSMPLFGENGQPTIDTERFGTVTLATHDHFRLIESDLSPIKFFLEPVAVSLNYVEQTHEYDVIVMTGLSGGGWTTVLYSAIDPRISHSYPVAGAMPFFLYEDDDMLGDYEQSLPELYRIANYEELFIMGAYGDGRSQLQIFNVNDPCCFDGNRHKAYEPIVRETLASLGNGEFGVLHDKSVSGHVISDEALKVISRDLEVK